MEKARWRAGTWLEALMRTCTRPSSLSCTLHVMLGGAVLLASAPVQAQYATGGVGQYRDNIVWFDWGDADQPIPQAGDVVSNDILVAGSTLRITCTLSNISGTGGAPDLKIYRPGGYFEDGLDDLYNVMQGGTNVMDIGLANRNSSESATFTYTCSATLDGTPYPLDGLVFADAETTNDGEFIRADLPAGTVMRVIERYRAPGCSTGYDVNASGTTYTFSTRAPYSCYLSPGSANAMGIYFIDNTSNSLSVNATITVSSQGGLQAVALGVSTHVADFGDAPASYGVAAHTPQFAWSGGTLPQGDTDIFDPGFSPATLNPPATAVLGTQVDSERTSQHSVAANGDNLDGVDDEDGLDVSTLPPLLRGRAGQSYTVPIACKGSSPVAGWIDFDRNGTFESDERSATASCSSGTATLVWTINADTAAGSSYMRIRTALAAADIDNPTGVATSGEVEDYAITIADPRVRIAKLTTGGVGGPFSFSATNTVSQPQPLTTVAIDTAAVGAALSVQNLAADTVLVEDSRPIGWILGSISCRNDGTGGMPTVAYSLVERKATLAAGSIAAGANITCTFTNVAPAVPVPFASCPSDAFITHNSNLYSLNLLTGVMTDIGSSGPLFNNAVNAIGFRQADGFIWGYFNNADGSGYRLVRIGQGGQADLPYATRPTGMGYNNTLNVADIQPGTGYYVTAHGGEIFVVDVTTNAVVTRHSTTEFNNSTDLAFNPVDGKIYSVRSATGEVFRYDLTTNTASPALITLPLAGSSGGWGGIFFDSGGTMYAYRSGGGIAGNGVVHRIFNVSGTGGPITYDVLAPSAAGAANLDGARCPAAAASVPPAVLLRKTTVGAPGGAFGFTLNNTVSKTASVSTSVAGTAVQVDGDSAQAGTQLFTVLVSGLNTDLTIEESSLAGGWKLSSAQCLNRAGTVVGSLSGAVYTIPAVDVQPDELFTCDFSNAQLTASLSITKDNGVTSVVSGTSVTYTIVVSNAGPDSADGALVQDPAVPGLTCSTAVCNSPTGNAVCPSASAVTVSALQSGPGVAIPSLPASSSVQFQLSCSVN